MIINNFNYSLTIIVLSRQEVVHGGVHVEISSLQLAHDHLARLVLQHDLNSALWG